MSKENSTTLEAERISVVRPSLIRPVFERTEIAEVARPHLIPRHQHLKYEVIFVDRGFYRCRHTR